MRIDVPSLREGENSLEFVESPQSLELGAEAAEFGPDIKVRLRLQRHNNEIVVWGNASGSLSEECSRCLGRGERKFDVEFEIFCDKIGARRDERPEDDRGTDTFLAHHDGRVLDIAPCVREALMLSLPMKPLCSEDCKGLCAVCGANLNETTCECGKGTPETRWSILERLKREQK
ncbi:MAG: DUF177 domain-containing protein [Candidatus Eisenbacteria bacterium]